MLCGAYTRRKRQNKVEKGQKKTQNGKNAHNRQKIGNFFTIFKKAFSCFQLLTHMMKTKIYCALLKYFRNYLITIR